MPDKKYFSPKLSNIRFLVTGGAGFIGSNIVEYLLANHAGGVVVLDNLATGSYKNIKSFEGQKNFRFMEGDIRSMDDCRRALENADIVLHQAALGSVPRSVKDPVTTHAVNAGGFINMLSASAEAGVKRFVYASSSSVYGDEPSLPKTEGRTGRPLSPYAVSKICNELDAEVFSRLHGLTCIGLRYFNIFGPKQSPEGPYAAVIPLFIRAALEGKTVYIDGDGEQTRDFTYVDNAVQANIIAATAGNISGHDVFNIAIGETCTVNELYRIICGVLGKSPAAVHREARKGDVRHSYADVAKAESLLGYRPSVRMKEGMERTVAYLRNVEGLQK